MEHTFTLAQQFVLLASDSATHKRRKPMRPQFQTYVAGAVLIELLSEEAIRVGDKGKLMIVRQQRGDEAARLVLDKLRGSKPKTMKQWIQLYYSRSKDCNRLFQTVIKPLLARGDLKEEHYRVLLFPVSRFEALPASRDRIVQRIRAELLEHGPVDRETSLLAMMLQKSKLLGGYFSEYERHELKRQLERLLQGEGDQLKTVRLVKKAIDEMDAVIATAGI